ncbi:MAG TPA: M48 family metallopeptidase [Candidatus Binatia bacterium]|jgi:predicted Zn-dependent protease|nr:M48 family metallopeptidase [Candidatus Binatia bacterium]
MHSRSRQLGALILALVVVSAAAAWAQGYPTQDSTSSSQPQSASSSQSAPPASTPDEPPSKPDKNAPNPSTLKNIDAIGNRNVGCNTGAGNWYSLEKQVAMGQQYSLQVEHGVKLVSDPVVTEYVNRIGQNLVRNSDSKVPFTIKVIDTDEINAFALPGGFFYVNSGLILAADNEAELAGVMAHEIAHVAACHVAREQTRGNIVNLASIPLVFVPGGWAVYEATQVAMGIGVPLTFMKFSRNFESEADFLGMEYMYKTGYDPQSFISFFEKIEAQEKKKPGAIAKAFSSHPMTPDRVTHAQQEMATVLPPRDEYVLNTSEFDQVKARLASINNKHKLQNDQTNGNRPTLRRSTADNPNPNGNTNGSQNDDDRPTLKRTDGSSSSSSSFNQ